MVSTKLFLTAAAAAVLVVVVHAQDITLIDGDSGAHTDYDFGTCIAIPDPNAAAVIAFNENAFCKVFDDNQCQNQVGVQYTTSGVTPLSIAFPNIGDSGGSIQCIKLDRS